MFSSDLSDDQLTMRLSHMSNTPCQVIFDFGCSCFDTVERIVYFNAKRNFIMEFMN